MDPLRLVATGFAVVLTLVGFLNYIPGLTDAQGRVFGVFALDIFDDALHFASAGWAAAAAFLGARASRVFLRTFGALYLADGLMGLAFGSGYLDLGIFIYGVQQMPFLFKIFANLPHVSLGAIGLASGFLLPDKAAAR